MTDPLRATVLVPTHDHGPTLRYSVASAMAQTVDELEILVVGDGVPDVTREVMADLCDRDKRIRFFDNHKAPRRGELLRHAALSEARGRIVCYLCDDDLWFPEHVETMERLLADAEFAHAYDAAIEPDQTFRSSVGDLSLPVLRSHLLAGFNFVPLSTAAHRLSAYRRLPFGWRTTPERTPTDLYMWQQFMEQAWCRGRSADVITVLRFPSPSRPGWSLDERLAELEHWADRMGKEGFRERLGGEAAAWFRWETVRKLVSEVQWKDHAGHLERKVGSLEAEVSSLQRRLAHHERQAAEQDAALVRTSEALQHACAEWGLTAKRFESVARDFKRLEAELDRVHRTMTWRLRNHVLGFEPARLAVSLLERVRARERGAAP